MYVFYKRALPKMSITPYVCVTSLLKSVFATTNVHLFLAESGMPAEYAFDQLIASQIYRNLVDLHTQQDLRTPA